MIALNQVAEMHMDLLSRLSYNRRNEPKLVFDATKRALRLYKSIPEYLTSIPKVQAQTEHKTNQKQVELWREELPTTSTEKNEI